MWLPSQSHPQTRYWICSLYTCQSKSSETVFRLHWGNAFNGCLKVQLQSSAYLCIPHNPVPWPMTYRFCRNLSRPRSPREILTLAQKWVGRTASLLSPVKMSQRLVMGLGWMNLRCLWTVLGPLRLWIHSCRIPVLWKALQNLKAHMSLAHWLLWSFL